MKYIATFLFVLGLAIVGGAEAHEWFPMFAAQVALGTMTMISGLLFATQVGDDDE